MQDKLLVTLHTPLAILRPWKPEDAAWYVSARDEEIFRWTTERRELTVEETENAIQTINASDNIITWAITDSKTLELVGNIALVYEQIERCVEVSYFLASWGRGRGIASSALNAVCQWAFENLDMDRIVLQTYPGNIRSQQLALRVGFHPVAPQNTSHALLDPVWFELRKNGANSDDMTKTNLLLASGDKE